MSKLTIEQSQSKKKKKFNWRLLLAIILFIIGGLLVSADFIKDVILSDMIKKQDSQFLKLTARELELNNQVEASFDFNEIDAIDVQNVLSNSVKNAKVPAIGAIAIPSVELNLTIGKGMANYTMLVGAGTMKENQKMGEGNYALASHYSKAKNETLLFAPLLRIKEGAKVYLTDLKYVYEYVVTWKEVVADTRVDLVYEEPKDKPIITLITCYYLPERGRVAVRGELVSKVPVEQASREAKDAFKLEIRTKQ